MNENMPGDGSKDWIRGDASTELSSNRTDMSFERTRMSADRTLMSIQRTALSLIGFGFTIFQFFRYLALDLKADNLISMEAARRFGMALVMLGVLLLVLGIWKHITFMLALKRQHAVLANEKLLHGPRSFPLSVTLIIAILLLVLGVVAIVGMLLRAGPLH